MRHIRISDGDGWVGHCGVYRGFGWDESESWELSSNISPSCSGAGSPRVSAARAPAPWNLL